MVVLYQKGNPPNHTHKQVLLLNAYILYCQ